MLNILLKHFIYDTGISVLFDNLIKSFNINLYGKWAGNPEAFMNDHKIGSVLYVDYEFWIIDAHNNDKANKVIKINNYPTIIYKHLSLGADNNLRLYVYSDLIIYNDPNVALYDVITERWKCTRGLFKDYLNRDVMISLGYDLWKHK